jgi:hypothetical protein
LVVFAVVRSLTRYQKNKSQKNGMFFRAKIPPSTNHISPPKHHNLTIKKPSSAPVFLQNPQQKHPSTTRRKIHFARGNLTIHRGPPKKINPSIPCPTLRQGMEGRDRK